MPGKPLLSRTSMRRGNRETFRLSPGFPGFSGFRCVAIARRPAKSDDGHSSRNACDGWITAARTAGNKVAQTATAIRQAAVPEIDMASHGATL